MVSVADIVVMFDRAFFFLVLQLKEKKVCWTGMSSAKAGWGQRDSLDR